MYHRKDDAEHNYGLEVSARNTGWMGRPGGRVPGGVSAFHVAGRMSRQERGLRSDKKWCNFLKNVVE